MFRTPYNVMLGYQRLGGSFCLHHPDDGTYHNYIRRHKPEDIELKRKTLGKNFSCIYYLFHASCFAPFTLLLIFLIVFDEEYIL